MNGRAAIDTVIANYEFNNFHSSDFHIIFMDSNMPIMDSFDSTLAIRNFLKSKGLPQPIIIGVTGQTEESYIVRAYQCGMNGVSGKPVDTAIIEKVLRVMKFIDWERWTIR